jgi:hypothetical protein
VPDAAVWALVEQFDRTFTLMLKQLTLAWSGPNAPLGTFDPTNADDPINTMDALSTNALDLMDKKRPDNVSVYGPSFRLV